MIVDYFGMSWMLRLEYPIQTSWLESWGFIIRSLAVTMSANSIDIRYFWSTYQGTWWDWTRSKLWKLPFYVASCVFYAVIWTTAILGIAFPKNASRSRRNYVAGTTVLVIFLLLLFTKPILDLVTVMLIVVLVKLVSDLLETLRNLLAEAIVFGCLLTLNYYQANPGVFAVTAGLQIFGFCLLALSADFDTPLKRWMKCHCSTKFRRFLARFLKLKYFHCSNPIEEKVFRTHLFLTNGNCLNSFGFELDTFAELDRSSTGKVSVTRAGPHHTRFTIEGVARGIIVETGPRNDEQEEVLEYIAHHPEACFVKAVSGFRGRYCSIEEYSKLLSSEDIHVCRFPKTAALFTKERDLDLFVWMGRYRRYLPKWCEKLAGVYVRYTGVYSPLESPPLIQRHLYFAHSILGFGSRISWRSATPSDGVLMF